MKGKSLFGDLSSKNLVRYNLDFEPVFTSIPAKFFYSRGDVSAFVLSKNKIPVNPYMNFDYNLMNSVSKQVVRIANNNLIKLAKQVWIFSEDFGNLTDGVLFEIIHALKLKKKIKFFKLPFCREIKIDPKSILKINEIKPHYGVACIQDWPTTYLAIPSNLFCMRFFLSKFTLEQRYVPLNPFTIFDYFLMDKVNRDSVISANLSIIKSIDELWAFSPASDGVIAEIKLAKKLNKKVRYFRVVRKKYVEEISSEDFEVEPGLKKT